MGKISYQSHTADICIHVRAYDLQDLFSTALEGMNEILFGKETEGSQTPPFSSPSVQIQLQSPDRTALLIDFLSEVLTLSYEKGMRFSLKNSAFPDTNYLIAELEENGSPKLREEIKAVTYHLAEIRSDSSGKLETQIIFDI